MKKAIIPIALMLMLAMPVTGFAESAPAPSPGNISSFADEQVTVTDTLPTSGSVVAGSLSSAGAGDPLAYPSNVEEKKVNGRYVIVKTYEVSGSFDPENLVEPDFELDGYIYRKSQVLKNALPDTVERKLAYETVSIRTESGKDAEIMGHLAPLLDYSEGEYSGQLELDYSSISTVVEDTKSYSYAVKETKEYAGLDRNDVSYIPKTITKNGQTLQLSDVNWTSLGGAVRGDAVVPSAYTATALYCGTGYGSSATGYLSTAIYKGEISRQLPGLVRYSILYEGEKIPTQWGKYVLIGFGILVAIGAIIAICILGKKFVGEMITRHMFVIH